MVTIPAFEAKAHLSSLLERAAAGEEFVITKHGRPIARLIGAEQADRQQGREALAKLLDMRRGTTLAGLDWRRLREEGRR